MPPSPSRSILVCVFLFFAGAGASASPGRFEAIPGFARTEAATVIALPRGRLFVGGEDGAWRAGPEGTERLLAGRAVRAVVVDRGGAMWVGTASGLWIEERTGAALREVSLGTGAGRDVRSLAATPAGVFVGTAAGPWFVPAGSAARAIAGVPRRAVVALLAGDAGVHAVTGDAVFLLRPGAAGTVAAERVALPMGTRGLRDAAQWGGVAWLLAGSGVYRLAGTHAERVGAGMPAGVDPHAIASDACGLWVATGRGVYHSAAGLRWDPVGVPGVPFVDVVSGPSGRYAVGPRGVFGEAPAMPGGRTAPRAAVSGTYSRQRPDPPIEALQRAVIRAQGLSTGRLARWRRRVAGRGLWPEVEFRLGLGGGRRRTHDHDQSFTSGALRDLHDERRDRDRDFDLMAVVRWDLGDARYHPEEVDVARETREWIELRDEILDEVGRIYFERQALLSERARRPPADPEAVRLRRRAEELAAGLDAWSDGWWTHQLEQK